ncbi:MAG TPA: flippase activity-associated protein Agl23, partial [Pyrinomonadaceae bacterium]|nr:flippase activity-associated protein Agl23 [Pyrinomonadaceae bacterium]
HDEGVNGNFLTRLVREGVYRYDPENYHGPTIYYFAAFFPWVLRFLFGTAAQDKYGLNTITIRLIPALFGLATVWLVLLLRRHLGAIGALGAALLLAISPGAVYLSRYFIHESLFVFFTLGLVVAALKYYEESHPVYLLLTAICAALLFATKETALISLGVLVIALAMTLGYRYFRRGDIWGKQGGKRSPRGSEKEKWSSFVGRLGGPTRVAIWGLVAIAIFIGLNVLFYSSFFKNYPQGVYDSVRTFQFWTKTGKLAHVHPLTTYIYWLIRQESPILILSTISAVLVVWKPRNSFALFAALWGFGILAAYSLISYKTPWLGLNFIVPLALAAGYTLQRLWEEALGHVGLIAALVVAIGISGYQTIDLNFFNYDNDDQYYVYVYAHTRRETLAMLNEIDRVVERAKEGNQTGITIIAPEYWPLPWYFRNFTRVGYNGRMAATTEPIIIAAESQGAEVESAFGQRYQQVNSGFNAAGSYPLRPGVNFLLYVRRDLAPSSDNPTSRSSLSQIRTTAAS